MEMRRALVLALTRFDVALRLELVDQTNRSRMSASRCFSWHSG
jgi:hypothetical protein